MGIGQMCCEIRTEQVCWGMRSGQVCSGYRDRCALGAGVRNWVQQRAELTSQPPRRPLGLPGGVGVLEALSLGARNPEQLCCFAPHASCHEDSGSSPGLQGFTFCAHSSLLLFEQGTALFKHRLHLGGALRGPPGSQDPPVSLGMKLRRCLCCEVAWSPPQEEGWLAKRRSKCGACACQWGS